MSDLADLEWPLRTARLTLRPARTEDLEAIWLIRRQEAVSTWMTYTSTDWTDFAERAAEPTWLPATLVVELDGSVIGDLMIRLQDAWAQGEVAEQAVGMQAELGWCFDPAYQGRGYASEAVAELIRISFADLGLHRVTALCFVDNEPSWRLMERLGLRREAHHVKDSLHRSRGWLDGFVYAQLAEEWTSS